MSREWKEANGAWQASDIELWEDEPAEPDEKRTAQLYGEDNEAVTDLSLSSPLIEDSSSIPSFSKFEGLQHFGQQISPIVIPLVFGGMTFLFILSLARVHSSFLHPVSLWPIALVLIALAILQGMALYYAGANNVYWSLGVISGFFLFMLVGCFVIFGPVPAAILLAILLIVGIIAGRFSMRPVPEGTVDIVYAFGKYTRTLYPGLNFILPWERVETHLHTRERQWTCPEQTVQISRPEDVHLKATISYQLIPEDASLAITQVDDWEESLRDLFVAAVQEAASKLTPDDFLAEHDYARQHSNLFLRPHEDEDGPRWQFINNLVFQRIRDRVASWGVLVNWVQVRDVTLTPHVSTGDTSPQVSIPPADADSPPQAAKKAEPEKVNSAKATPPPPAPAQPPKQAAPVTPAPGKILKEEVLIAAYNQIKSGKVRSPETIRRTASQFQAIAQDPEASKNVSFDAARAAQVLFERATYFEQQQAAVPAYQDGPDEDSHERPTESDWMFRPPSDENITLGG